MGAPRRAGHTQASDTRKHWHDELLETQLRCEGDDPDYKLSKATIMGRKMLAVAEKEAAEALAKRKPAPTSAREVLPTGPSEYQLRNHVFLTLQHGDSPLGRLVFKLYDEYAPQACHNFRSICEQKNDFGLTYEGTKLHKLEKGQAIYGGDMDNGDGTGGRSIFGKPFVDEVNPLKHDDAGVLSMVHTRADSNTSLFLISLAAAPELDEKNVVFGRIIAGAEFLPLLDSVAIHDQGHHPTLRPVEDITILSCGLYSLINKGEDAGNDELDPEDMDELQRTEAVYHKAKKAKLDRKEARDSVKSALAMGLQKKKSKKKIKTIKTVSSSVDSSVIAGAAPE